MSALRLELRPSAPLAAAIAAAHSAAGIALLPVLPGTVGALACAALVALGIAAARSRALLRAASSVKALEIDGAELTLVLKDGRRSRTRTAGRRYASRYLVIIPGRRTILLVPGMLDAGSFRRLRMWALWGRFPGVPARAVARTQLPA